MIELKNVSKIYGKNDTAFTALDNITVSIEQGESVAIVGKSGSGKSTLMHVMSGLDRASEGQIIVDNEDIARLSQKKIDAFRAHTIGFIFQSFFVQANESCYHNVSLPLEICHITGNERRSRIRQALSQVGLQDKIHEKARNLSGGQRQRLAIARAIVTKPRILFADEPTGNLDSATGDAIEKLLFDLNKRMGTTLIIVTHDADLASQCKRRIYLKDGKLASPPKPKRSRK